MRHDKNVACVGRLNNFIVSSNKSPVSVNVNAASPVRMKRQIFAKKGFSFDIFRQMQEYRDRRKQRIAKEVEKEVEKIVGKAKEEAYQKGYEAAKAESRSQEKKSS